MSFWPPLAPVDQAFIPEPEIEFEPEMMKEASIARNRPPPKVPFISATREAPQEPRQQPQQRQIILPAPEFDFGPENIKEANLKPSRFTPCPPPPPPNESLCGGRLSLVEPSYRRGRSLIKPRVRYCKECGSKRRFWRANAIKYWQRHSRQCRRCEITIF